ncbi:MAG TPA: malto-oligosyltrehalose trehalohydrolase [Candidatus Limnocylindrales bacterium]|nr:malto-oligosyltrehalose trehalohydrolase [Candidatus Limnocylindrales bacterium]
MADLGARPLGGGRCRFRVWAPRAGRVEVRLLQGGRVAELHPEGDGHHAADVPDVAAGARYRYRIDGARELPDPASRWQPDGVHGPSAVLDPLAHRWSDGGWRGLERAALVTYELHVGTFTREGTLDAIVPHLAPLRDLGVTAIELMPLAQFPGERNWGYDGVYPYAVQASYGGPDAMRRLVDAAHGAGLAVIVDVVYNHLGPEGNYLGEYGPYFTDRYLTPWGPAVNFDGPDSDGVREYFIENANMWIREYHADGLRLDAVHAILDRSATPFLQELAVAVREAGAAAGRRVHVIAESNLNDARLIRPVEHGGLGLDAQWSDDLHHALHVALTGERDGYYVDFTGLPDLARALREGWVYQGQRSAFRRRRHGNSTAGLAGDRFVVFAQDHDQVGNRMLGERLSSLVGPRELRLAAAAVILSPYLPLLFMGEEYGETAPFQYFTSHGDADLAEAVRRGRREEFAEFAEFARSGETPDPQDPATFERSRLRHELAERSEGAALRAWYAALLRLRREVPALASLDPARTEVLADEAAGTLALRRWSGPSEAVAVLHFGAEVRRADLPIAGGPWRRALHSEDAAFGGAGARGPERITAGSPLRLDLEARSVTVLVREAG